MTSIEGMWHTLTMDDAPCTPSPASKSPAQTTVQVAAVPERAEMPMPANRAGLLDVRNYLARL